MLLMLDLPEPDLPMRSTFFFLGFLTSGRSSAAGCASVAAAADDEASGLDAMAGLPTAGKRCIWRGDVELNGRRGACCELRACRMSLMTLACLYAVMQEVACERGRLDVQSASLERRWW